jgi:ribosomal protein S27AE
MATFVKHESCPKCGSKDNLGRYDDGSAYCFGCGYTEFSSHYVPKTTEDSPKVIKLPEDTSAQIDKIALDWLDKYAITQTERVRYRMLWSKSKQQLIFPLYDGSGKLIAWQARNFSPEAKSKYYSQGKIHDVMYFCGAKTNPIILVEDLVSAIKIGRVGVAMPLFGSEASTHLLMRLKTQCRGIIVWLDSDKWKNSHDIVNRSKSIGLPALSVFTNLDPKEYNDEKIKYFLTH